MADKKPGEDVERGIQNIPVLPKLPGAPKPAPKPAPAKPEPEPTKPAGEDLSKPLSAEEESEQETLYPQAKRLSEYRAKKGLKEESAAEKRSTKLTYRRYNKR